MPNLSKPAVAATGVDAKGDKMIVMKGPLAEIFCRALNVAYAKPDALTGEVAMESQAIDTVLLKQQQSKTNVNPQNAPVTAQNVAQGTVKTYTVYGVNPKETQPEDIVAVKSEISNMTEEEKERFVLVVDSCVAGPNSQHVGLPEEAVADSLSTALEAFADFHGIKTYKSLGRFMKAIR